MFGMFYHYLTTTNLTVEADRMLSEYDYCPAAEQYDDCPYSREAALLADYETLHYYDGWE